MRRWGVPLVVLLCAFGVVLRHTLRKRPVREPFDPSRLYRVIGVQDGDTFTIDCGEEVRVVGVDTPEKGRPFSRRATDFARRTLLGRLVRVEPAKQPRDKYGRLLGWVWMESGKLFNEEVLKRGLGYLYLVEQNTKYKERLLAAQREARAKRRGLWRHPPKPEPYYVVAGQGASRTTHRPNCPRLRHLPNHKVYKSRNEALDTGAPPCRICNP